jgi:hypothetical protein
MSGLIEEIQRDALSTNVPIDALLRRVKLAAAKLQLSSLEAWVEQELNGYNGEVPAYRKIVGEPTAWNPFRGWIPVFSEDERFMDLISEAPLRDPVGTLQDLINNNSGGRLQFPLPVGLVASINQITDFQTSRMAIRFGRGSIVSIIDTVRNKVLDWAIEMERRGVLGHGMSFDPQEKIQARNAMTTFNIGSIGNFVGNMGAGNSSGDIVASIDVVQKIKDVITKIESSQDELVRGGVNGKLLSSKMREIDAAVKTVKPEKGRLKALLEDARTILTGAAGNLTAEGAIAMIKEAVHLLG